MGPNRRGIVLSGGGARGAYQAGVMLGISRIVREAGLLRPFDVYTGISAGAINAASLAAGADRFEIACAQLGALWRELRTYQVFRTDPRAMATIGARLAWDLLLGGLHHHPGVRSLVDTSPLRAYLGERLPLERIERNLARGHFQGIALTAAEYATSESVTFFRTREPAPAWRRVKRRGEPVRITLDHVMASAAIPLFFPPQAVGALHYGDGGLRNSAPLSPAIHLGADRLVIVGVRYAPPPEPVPEARAHIRPTFARVLGTIFHSIFLDAIESDLERLERINRTLRHLRPDPSSAILLRPIRFVHIHPSQDPGVLAMESFHALPRAIRYLIEGLGSHEEASELVSYLLFEPAFLSRLVDLGEADALAARDQVLAVLAP